MNKTKYRHNDGIFYVWDNPAKESDMEDFNELDPKLEEKLELELIQYFNLKPGAIKKMTFTDEQARSIVRLYYRLQKFRIKTSNQTKAFQNDKRPDLLVSYFANNMKHIESQCKAALDSYSASKPLGRWARSIPGIAETLSAGLLANIDISKCPVVSHIWRYAGLDPTVIWITKEPDAKAFYSEIVGSRGIANDEQLATMAVKLNRNPELFIPQMKTISFLDKDGNRQTREAKRADQINLIMLRPWNADLKTLCWKIGESFLKQINNPDSSYGILYNVRKAYEVAKNERGDYAAEAEKKLKNCNITDADTRKCYESGHLPDGHIHARVKRYVVKIFLSHYHAVGYELLHGEKPPKPFAIAILNHAHEIPIPNWPNPNI